MPLPPEQVLVGCRTSKLVSLYDSISLSVDFDDSELREHALLAPQVLDGNGWSGESVSSYPSDNPDTLNRDSSHRVISSPCLFEIGQLPDKSAFWQATIGRRVKFEPLLVAVRAAL
jgi:hypothetical protein